MPVAYSIRLSLSFRINIYVRILHGDISQIMLPRANVVMTPIIKFIIIISGAVF